MEVDLRRFQWSTAKGTDRYSRPLNADQAGTGRGSPESNQDGTRIAHQAGTGRESRGLRRIAPYKRDVTLGAIRIPVLAVIRVNPRPVELVSFASIRVPLLGFDQCRSAFRWIGKSSASYR